MSAGAGGIDAPTEELRADLAAVKAGGAGASSAAKRLIAAGIEYFDVALDPASVVFDPRYRDGALAFKNGIVLIGPSQFETFGLLGSTLIHEFLHIGGSYYPPDSLGGLIQEAQVLGAELSRAGSTGINATPVERMRSRYLYKIQQFSPSSYNAVISSNYRSAYIADFESNRR